MLECSSSSSAALFYVQHGFSPVFVVARRKALTLRIPKGKGFLFRSSVLVAVVAAMSVL
jgi:hypothetical protein